MKQYIKKALWIIPFVFSSNLSGAYFYYIGSTPSNRNHWNTSKTAGTGATSGKPTAAQFFSSGHEFDFNGKSADLSGITTTDAKIKNTGSSCTLTVSSGTFTIADLDFAANLTLTNLAIDFSTGGTVKYAGAGIQSIYPTSYSNLSLEGLSGSALLSTGTVTISQSIALEGVTFQNNATFILGFGSQISIGNTSSYGTFINNGTFTDNRSSANQIHYWGYEHLVSSNLPKGTFSSFCKVSASCTLSGNTTVNSLTIGRSTSAQILSCSTYLLELKGTLTFNIKTSTSDTSGIDCTDGSLKISRSSSLTLFPCYLRSNIAAGGARSDIANLIINSSNGTVVTLSTQDATLGAYNYQMPKVSNSCSIAKGSLKLDGGILRVDGSYELFSTDGIIIDVNDSTTDKLDLNQPNSSLIITSATTPITYTPNYIRYQTIQNLVLNFSSGGIFQIPEKILIPGDLEFYDNTNYIELGGNTLKLTGSLSPNGASDGYFIGSSNSKIISSVNSGILYFDQTTIGTTNYLEEIQLLNSSDITLGNDLVTKSVSLGTGKLHINDNTLTIENSMSNSGGFSGGSLVGSPKSNLICQGNMTLYFDQSVDENRTLKNLTIGGNTIAVTLGNWLNITGGTSTSGFGIVDVIAGSNNLYTQGYLTLKSNEFGTAMTSSSPGSIKYSSGNNTGTLLVENYIPYQKSGGSSKGRQYRFLSSPVLNGTFYQWRDSILDNHISNTSGTPNNNKGIQITGASPNSPTGNFDESTTNNPSLFTYNENNAGSSTGIGNSSSNEDAGWTAATDGLGSITNGKGYRVLVRGDRKISLKSTSNVTPNNTTIQTRGGYVTGRVDVTITNSGTNTNNGINLVGNPYSSAIDWVTVHTASSNLDAAYVIWDVENLSYQSYTAGGSGAASRYISPGQGFLVYCTALGGSKSSPASGYIRFEDNAKTTINGNGGRFFQEVKTNHLITILRQDSTAADKTFIYFKSGATNYYDQFDAGHIQNNNANLASIDSSNTYYNVNCMDSLTNQRIIPLTLFGSPIGKYSMSFQDVNTFRNHDIFLIDNFTKKTTKIDDMTEIDITINSDLNSYKDGRLFLSFEPKNTTTVVTLKKSNAYKIGPNPVENNLIVSYINKEFSNTTYEIVNINGQILNTGTVEKDNNSIFTGYLERGIYFITLKNNIETQTIKFIK
jgi:hypothetical protein